MTMLSSSVASPLSLQEMMDAFPLFRSWQGKRVVVKLGGSSFASHQSILLDLLWLQALGAYPIIVHGGGPSIDAYLEKLQMPRVFFGGVRKTDAQTLEVVRLVLCGQINPHLVALTTQLGGRAVGLSGIDGHMILASIADPILGLVGRIERVNPELIQELLYSGFIPIIAPLGLDASGQYLNIYADMVAAHIARALSAQMLAFISDVAGVQDTNGYLFSHLSSSAAFRFIDQGVICGGMIPKIQAGFEAAQTVPQVYVLGGSAPHLLFSAIMGQETGTRLECPSVFDDSVCLASRSADWK
jgi:acetylglutamate kinase